MTGRRSISTARGTVTYREAGEGPPLLLLHGIGSGAASWAAQLDALSDRYRVVAWDAPGYGGSDAIAPAEPAAADYAATLAAFLDALGIDAARLVGHSLGALMACAFASRNSGRLTGLMIADPAAGYGKADPEIRAERLAARLGLLERLGPEGMANERSGALLSDGASEEARERVRKVMSEIRPDGYRQAVAMLFRADIHEDARRINLPVLVVCGGDDTVTPPEGCRKVADSFSESRFVLLPGLGHASYVEGVEAFNDALLGHFGEAS
ncbi:MAG: alpha/beta fold hydrolase [Alphaproteobacteria bacterium]